LGRGEVDLCVDVDVDVELEWKGVDGWLDRWKRTGCGEETG
jgi:hypothetical protein